MERQTSIDSLTNSNYMSRTIRSNEKISLKKTKNNIRNSKFTSTTANSIRESKIAKDLSPKKRNSILLFTPKRKLS